MIYFDRVYFLRITDNFQRDKYTNESYNSTQSYCIIFYHLFVSSDISKNKIHWNINVIDNEYINGKYFRN